MLNCRAWVRAKRSVETDCKDLAVLYIGYHWKKVPLVSNYWMSELNERRWALKMWIMSPHTNDVGLNLNNKENYVLESCWRCRGGDLKFGLRKIESRMELIKPVKYLKSLQEYLICRCKGEWQVGGKPIKRFFIYFFAFLITCCFKGQLTFK